MTKPTTEIDLDEILDELSSADGEDRAKALRRLCPCRNAWELFAQHRELVARLKKDPSPAVRRAALHIFEDAAEEQSDAYPTHPKQNSNEMIKAKRSSRFPTDKEELEERRSKPNHRTGRRKHGR